MIVDPDRPGVDDTIYDGFNGPNDIAFNFSDATDPQPITDIGLPRHAYVTNYTELGHRRRRPRAGQPHREPRLGAPRLSARRIQPMTRARSIAAIVVAALAWAVVTACKQTTITDAARSFDRPSDVALACVQYDPNQGIDNPNTPHGNYNVRPARPLRVRSTRARTA